MTTLRMVNGDLAVDEDRGLLQNVTGLEEGSQNVARHLLSDYNTFFDEGNELLNYAFGGTPAGFTELVVDNLLTEAVNRLILKQRNSNTGNRILKVIQVKTKVASLSTVVFLVEVLYESNERVSVVDVVKIRPTKLDHTFNGSAALTI